MKSRTSLAFRVLSKKWPTFRQPRDYPDDKDVVKMTKDCGTDGHECLEWLQRKYAPTW